MTRGQHLICVLTVATLTAHAGTPRRQIGLASYYGWAHQGRLTASGERFDVRKFTAASRTLALGTRVRVCLPATATCTAVRINDRGPYIKGRIIDLSLAAAQVLGLTTRGIARVVITEQPP